MRVAITGGIAEGKTTILGYLRDAGYSVESSDTLAREVFRLPAVQDALAALLACSAPVDPDLLRRNMGDPAIRRAVNGIMHGPIAVRLRASKAQFVEVPLLIEVCLQGEFDRVWIATCGKDMQFSRLLARLGDAAAARGMMESQLSTRAKLPFADCIFRTNRSESSVKRSVSLAARQEFV